MRVEDVVPSRFPHGLGAHDRGREGAQLARQVTLRQSFERAGRHVAHHHPVGEVHDLPPVVDLADGVVVRHVAAGPFEGLSKGDLPGQLCAFTAAVMRAEAVREPGWYDVLHAHYWLSGQVGWLAAERWDVPLVTSMHTLARVKNAFLAEGDTPEPRAREIGE